MLIILEGVDGSGKTTLMKNLIDLELVIPFDTVKQYDEYAYSKWCALIDDSCNTIYDIVVDRSFISDLVYRLTDDKKVGTLNLLNMILLLQRNDAVKIIYCKTDTSFDDAITRGEDNIIDKDIHSLISKNYDVIITMLKKFTNVPIMEYNWKKDSTMDIIKFVQGGI